MWPPWTPGWCCIQLSLCTLPQSKWLLFCINMHTHPLCPSNRVILPALTLPFPVTGTLDSLILSAECGPRGWTCPLCAPPGQVFCCCCCFCFETKCHCTTYTGLELTVLPRMALNSGSSFRSLCIAEITNLYHHAWLNLIMQNIQPPQHLLPCSLFSLKLPFLSLFLFVC